MTPYISSVFPRYNSCLHNAKTPECKFKNPINSFMIFFLDNIYYQDISRYLNHSDTQMSRNNY